MSSDTLSATRILIVDDQDDIRKTLRFLLKQEGYHVFDASSPNEAFSILEENQVDLILTDMNFHLGATSGREGLAFLVSLSQVYADITIVAMTSWSSVTLAIEVMQKGASDLIEKPWENEQLFKTIAKQFQARQHLVKTNPGVKTQKGIIYQSELFAKVISTIEKVSKSNARVILTGENGTGKSLLANYLHQCSQRRNEPFICVNLGALPEQLFETELFGHKKGAYTGAHIDRVGRIAAAKKGTLFLDELATTCLTNQAKLLRVLESGHYECVGSNKTQNMNCRIISATNGNLQDFMTKNMFREDLYYRLNTIEIYVPSLKERREDILPIAEYYLKIIGKEYDKPELKLSKNCRRKLEAHSWPGNTRELKHTIERAILLSDSNTIELDDLTEKTKQKEELKQVVPLAELEESMITLALKQAKGNINLSAELLGISRNALYRRIEKHGIKYKKYL
jgi:DNA-binding NtrC family response regulator